MAETTALSIVAPVHNDVECLDELHRRLVDNVAPLTPDFEIVLVDDGSRDGTWDKIRSLAATDPRVRGVRLSRNFGQHFAITAGLSAARGERAVVMDSDLQERPEEIPKLWEKMNEGYDTIFARRKKRRDAFWKRFTSQLFFVIINRVSGQNVDGEVGTLSMIRRPVIDSFLSVTDAHRHYLYILRLVGFKQAYVDVEHAARFAGTTSYNFPRLFRHALDGITSQSTRLLQMSTSVGFLCIVFAALQVLWLIYKRVVLHESIEGWTSLMVSIWFLGGAILASLGVLGLYLGKTFEQVKRRPLFIVSERTFE